MTIQIQFEAAVGCHNLFQVMPDGRRYIGEVYDGRWDPCDMTGEGFTPNELRAIADTTEAIKS